MDEAGHGLQFLILFIYLSIYLFIYATPHGLQNLSSLTRD